MSEPKVKFFPNRIYHIYSHGNADDNIFKSEENYNFFLKRYVEYITPVASTFAYCLLPNHFHFAIKIKRKSEFINLMDAKWKNHEDFLSHCFGTFLNAYAKSFNKIYNRTGSLFRENLQKKVVDDYDYLINLIAYINQNPVRHGFVKTAVDWKYSSYNATISEKKSLLNRPGLFELFKAKENFMTAVQKPANEK